MRTMGGINYREGLEIYWYIFYTYSRRKFDQKSEEKKRQRAVRRDILVPL